MVDMAEIWGPEALTPQPFAAADILAALGPLPGPLGEPVLVRTSATWRDRFPQLDSWFEDGGPLREALSRARTDKGREAAVWKHLATRRDHWARIIAASAAVLHAAKDPHWPAFAAVARAVTEDGTLKRIPVLHDIAGMTLAIWTDNHDDGQVGDGSDKGAENLLADAGLSGAFLDGYLTAYVIAPVAQPPSVWLGSLLSGIRLPGEGALNLILAAISDRIAQIEGTAPDPARVAARLALVAPRDLQDWCAGFQALVTAAPRAWSPRKLGPDDKRILRALDSVAGGQPDPGFAAALPAWIAQRHARRN
jgi:hypothetical protein